MSLEKNEQNCLFSVIYCHFYSWLYVINSLFEKKTCSNLVQYIEKCP